MITSRAGDEIYAHECQDAAPNKLADALCCGGLEVAVQNRTTDDDGDGEEDELRWYNLRGVETLQCAVDISDL